MPADGIRAELLSRGGFAYAKVPARDTRAVGRLGAAGFAIVDMGITLDWRGSSAPARPDERLVRLVRSADHGSVIALAGSSFSLSRFHLDPLFPGDLADAIKRDWIANYCRGGRGAGLYVALADDVPAGFLAVLTGGGDAAPWAAIDLVAVGNAWRGRGLGRALVDRFIADWHGRAMLRVGTQAANHASLSLYENAGFRIAETAYALHAHMGDGRILTC